MAPRGRPIRSSSRGRRNRTSQRRPWAALALASLVVVLAAAVLVRAFPGAHSASAGGESSNPTTLSLSGAASRGNPNATVVIEAYEDYLCPFCRRFFDSTEASLMAAYCDRIRFVFHDWPNEQAHPFATKASEAARCGGDQGKYWEMHDALYSRQGEWGYKSDSPAHFKRYAAELGLDTAKFNACLDSEAHRRDVLLDLDAAQRKGVAGTPTFIVGGQRIVGAQPFNVFAAAIESALSLEAARAAAS